MNWCDGFEVTLLGNTRNVCSLGNAVLLEGAVDGVARKEGFSAEWLI